jgi:hypothetical protein
MQGRGTDADEEEIDYPEDTRIGSEGTARSLPMQQHLDASALADVNLSNTIGELGTDMRVSGDNVADRAISVDSAIDEEIWVPDYAAEYDYAILFPATCTDNHTFKRYTDMFLSFKLEIFSYRGMNDIVVRMQSTRCSSSSYTLCPLTLTNTNSSLLCYLSVCHITQKVVLIRAPTDTLRNYADDINYKMKLDPAVMSKMCKDGIPKHDIGPISINHDPEVCTYEPFEYIYYKYSTRVPEELYYRPSDGSHPYSHPFGVKERLRLIATMLGMFYYTRMHVCYEYNGVPTCLSTV